MIIGALGRRSFAQKTSGRFTKLARQFPAKCPGPMPTSSCSMFAVWSATRSRRQGARLSGGTLARSATGCKVGQAKTYCPRRIAIWGDSCCTTLLRSAECTISFAAKDASPDYTNAFTSRFVRIWSAGPISLTRNCLVISRTASFSFRRASRDSTVI